MFAIIHVSLNNKKILRNLLKKYCFIKIHGISQQNKFMVNFITKKNGMKDLLNISDED